MPKDILSKGQKPTPWVLGLNINFLFPNTTEANHSPMQSATGSYKNKDKLAVIYDGSTLQSARARSYVGISAWIFILKLRNKCRLPVPQVSCTNLNVKITVC